MTNPVCPETGLPMHRGVRPMTLEYRGHEVTFDMPGWHCDQSEESVHTGNDMKVSDRMLNRLKARVDGLLESWEIRRIPKRLHPRQEAAGLLIGGGPRAFQEYEKGDLLPSRAFCGALILLDQNPDSLKLLRSPHDRSLVVEREGPGPRMGIET